MYYFVGISRKAMHKIFTVLKDRLFNWFKLEGFLPSSIVCWYFRIYIALLLMIMTPLLFISNAESANVFTANRVLIEVMASPLYWLSLPWLFIWSTVFETFEISWISHAPLGLTELAPIFFLSCISSIALISNIEAKLTYQYKALGETFAHLGTTHENH